MSKFTHVKLTEVHLWEDNPRTGSVENENEEIFALIRKQQMKNGNKLINLAESIIKDGLYEPIDILQYIDGFMVVKEGNRRVTCLKLLKNPEIIRVDYPELYQAFMKLKKDVNNNIFMSIPARIFSEDENEKLEKWVELRHNGLHGGEGLDKWGSYEKENWNSYRGRQTPLLDFHEYLITHDILSREDINCVSKTNWERILGTIGRSYLGIGLEDKKYIIKIFPNDFKKRIIKTVNSLRGKSVGAVYDNKSINKFFKDLNFEEEEQSSTVPQMDHNFVNESNSTDTKPEYTKENLVENTNHEGEDEDETQTETKTENDVEESQNDIPIESPSADIKKAHRQSKLPPLLSDLTCYLKHSEDTTGIIRLCDELKRISKSKYYREYPVAAAVLMRNLLKECLVFYLKKRNKWNELYNTKRKDPTFAEIVEKYHFDVDIFSQDRRLEKLMNIFTDSSEIKDQLAMIVNYPYQYAANPDLLDIIVNNGYLALVQYIINFN